MTELRTTTSTTGVRAGTGRGVTTHPRISNNKSSSGSVSSISISRESNSNSRESNSSSSSQQQQQLNNSLSSPFTFLVPLISLLLFGSLAHFLRVPSFEDLVTGAPTEDGAFDDEEHKGVPADEADTARCSSLQGVRGAQVISCEALMRVCPLQQQSHLTDGPTM